MRSSSRWLEADVNFKVVKDFVRKVTERATGVDVLESLSPAQMVIKIVNEELTALMGSENQKLNISSHSPSVVMLVGLQGAGKTTNGAKLAGLMRKQGKRPLLVACDVYRPAAIQQLETVGRQLDIPCSRWGRAIRSRSPRPASSTRKNTATTLSFSTRPAVCTLRRRSDRAAEHQGPPSIRAEILARHRREDRSGRGRDRAGL